MYVTHVDDGVPILHLSVIKKICAIIGPLSHTTRFSLKNSSISTRVVVYLSPRIVVIHFSFCHMISCSHVLLCSQVHISSEWHDQNSKFNVWFFSALRPTESQRFIIFWFFISNISQNKKKTKSIITFPSTHELIHGCNALSVPSIVWCLENKLWKMYEWVNLCVFFFHFQSHHKRRL